MRTEVQNFLVEGTQCPQLQGSNLLSQQRKIRNLISQHLTVRRNYKHRHLAADSRQTMDFVQVVIVRVQHRTKG